MEPESKTITLQVLGNDTFIVKPDPAELCRLCANTDNQLIPIFKGEGLEHNIPSKLEKHLPIVKITETDKLPLQVCYQCASTLIAWHNLYEGCSVADKRLREILAVDEKLYHDEETFEDYGDDFRDDDFDQPHADFVQLNTASTSSQSGLGPNTSISEITQLGSSNTFDETENNNLADERCLRWKYGSTKRFDDDVCANMSGIGRNTIEHSSSVTNDDLVNEFLVRRDEVPPSAKVERVSSNVCDCVWSNNECAKCAHYDCFKCSFCPMVFIYAGVRNRHLRMSHKNELVNQCGDLFLQNFIGRPAAENENDSLDDVVQYYCAECSDAFQNKVDLIGHLREHSLQMKCTLAKSSQNQRLSNGSVRRRSRSQYQCEHCSKVVSTKEGIKKHLSISHPCGTRVSFNQTVRKRSSKSTPGVKRNESDQVDAGALKNGYYTCDICGQIFLKRHSFTRHVNKHSSNRYNCDKCKKSFASETTLSTHQLRKHKELPKNVFFLNGRKYLKCNQCSFTCRNERNKLEEHMRVHTGEKPFTCELCGKQFRTKALLRVHNRYVHEGIKEHGCDICGRCFSNKRYMEEHRRIHTGEKPLICDLCGKTFRQNSSLSKHIENHLGIKKHACSLCDRRFSNSHHLSIHIKRHLGEASHKCEHCDKKFVDQYQLKNHKVVHSEARPFVCKLCGNGFKLRKHLKQHGRTHRS